MLHTDLYEYCVNREVIAQWFQVYPLFYLCLFIVLVIITIYRKTLSSNDEYRKRRKSYRLEELLKQQEKNQKSAVTTNDNEFKIPLTKLSTELLINILSYLDNSAILRLMSTSKSLWIELRADVIWEQLWLQTYGDVWRNSKIRKIRESRGIYWDPLQNFGPPQQGWFHFFLLFEVSWMDWLLAGFCTPTCCLVSVNHFILDLTKFVDEHPGSRETLMDGAGCDASETFAEIGHTTYAVGLIKNLYIWSFNDFDTTPVREEGFGSDWLANVEKESIGGGFKEFKRKERLPSKLFTKLHAQMKLNRMKVLNHAIQVDRLELRRKFLMFATNENTENMGIHILEGRSKKNIPYQPSFSEPYQLISEFIDYSACSGNHYGQLKCFYDPLSQEWVTWWTCCGQARTLIEDRETPEGYVEVEGNGKGIPFISMGIGKVSSLLGL